MALKDVYPFEYETGKESLAGLYYDSGDIRNNISWIIFKHLCWHICYNEL